MNRKEFIKLIKKEIKEHRAGSGERWTTNKDYSEKLNIPLFSIKYRLKYGLSPEDRSYRLSEIRSQTGKRAKGNPNFWGSKYTKKQRQFHMIKEKVSEEIVKIHKEFGGFKVVKIQPKSFSEKGEFLSLLFNEEGIKELSQGEKILQDLLELRRAMNNFKFPDFVCEKEKQVVFTEVKSNDSFDPTKWFKQKKSLEALHKKGYEVEVLSVPVDNLMKMLKHENTDNRRNKKTIFR